MQRRALGQSNIQASVVGFGAWAIGGWLWGGQEQTDAIRAIHAAIDEGIDLIDTAPIYGFGASEQTVGKAISDRREKVVLATKCGLVWDTRKGEHFFNSTQETVTQSGEICVQKYLGPESIGKEIEASLERLRTDHIDLYQTHWQESTTPIEDTMAELLRLKDQGKIRAIGVSNASPEQMDAYREVGPLDADQEKYSMLDRDLEDANMAYAADNGLAMLAYSPIAQGLLTGKMGPDRTFEEGDLRKDNDRFSVENRKRVQQLLDEFKPVAEAHDATMTQIVIAWTFHRRGCSHVLVGARNPNQAKENAAAGAIQLTDEQL
ncbi:MAG: aldo/keto reductase, partial [Phycisphaerae bacterium]